jgi:ABC-type polysaccharide/polyol phosphate export permease
MTTGPLTSAPFDAGRRSWRLRSLSGLALVLFPWNLFWDKRNVLLTLVRTQIARRHRRSLLGWAWNLIQPGSQALLIFYATQGAVRVPQASSVLEGFGIFFVAFIIAQGMGEIVGRGPSLVSERVGWVKGSLFPLELLAPTAVGVSLYRVVPGGLLGVACVALGGSPVAGAEALIAFSVGLAVAVVWGTALGLAFAALGVYLRDAILAAPVITMAILFISPLYVAPEVGGLAGLLVKLNPLTVSMDIILYGLAWIPDHPVHAVVGLVAPFVALWAAAVVFRRASVTFADYV